MKPGAIISAVFALACACTSVLSASILGLGVWGWLTIFGGLFVGVSPYISSIQAAGRAIALVMAILSLLAVALGLLAATVGGSFRLPSDQALLFALFGMIGISSIVYSRSKGKDKHAA
jgi:hypothetical protein